MFQVLPKNQAIRFICIGILNTLFGYSVFSLLIFIQFNSSLALVLSTLLGIFFNFNTLGRYVFDNTNKKLMIKFFSSYLVLMMINISLEKTAHLIIASNYLSGLLSIVVTAGLSYVINKNFVFK